MGIQTPISYMVPLAHPSLQPKWHLDWFSLFAGLTSVTNRQTDQPTDRQRYSVGNNRPHLVCSTAMQPNNTGVSEILNQTCKSLQRLDMVLLLLLHPFNGLFPRQPG